MNSSSEASMKLSDWIGNPQWRRLKEFQRRVAQRRRGSGLPNEPIGMFPNGKWVDGRIPLFLLPCNYAALQLIHHQLSLSHFQSFLAKESIHRQFRLIHGGAIAIPKLLRMELDWSETKMTGRTYHSRQKFIQRISRFASRLTTVNPGLNRNEEKSTETYSWSQIYQTKERMGKRVDPHLSRLSSKGGQSTIAVRNELQPPVKERHTNAKPTPLHDSILRGARLISTSAASSFFSHWTHLSSNQKVIACRNAGNETLFFFPIRDFLMNFLFVSLPEVSEETKATAIKHRVQWYSIRSSQLIPSWVWCRQKKKTLLHSESSRGCDPSVGFAKLVLLVLMVCERICCRVRTTRSELDRFRPKRPSLPNGWTWGRGVDPSVLESSNDGSLRSFFSV